MSDRFFVEAPIASTRVQLGGAQAHHLTHVMRAAAGDTVTLFDGSGVEFSARVSEIARGSVVCEVFERIAVDRERPYALTLAVALPKGDRQKWLVEKAVELGVTRLVPLKTTRGVAKASNATVQKLRRVVIEASKQCRRNRLLQISDCCSVVELTKAIPAWTFRMLADSSGSLLPQAADRCQSACFTVGPEGGFTRDEIAVAREAGWQIVSLGPRVLRVETAAITLAAWWQ